MPLLFALLLLLAGSARAAELPPALQGLGLRESPVAVREIPGWKPPTRVVVRSLFGPEPVERLAASLPGVELVPAATVAEAVAAVPGAQVLVGFCNQEIFDAATPTLRLQGTAPTQGAPVPKGVWGERRAHGH